MQSDELGSFTIELVPKEFVKYQIRDVKLKTSATYSSKKI